jgi:hypothetical protein
MSVEETIQAASLIIFGGAVLYIILLKVLERPYWMLQDIRDELRYMNKPQRDLETKGAIPPATGGSP